MPHCKTLIYMKKLIKFIKARIFHIRLRKAIREADTLTLKTGRKMLVLNLGGRPVAMAKIRIKQLVNHGYFKNASAADIEAAAIYKSY